MSDEDEPSDIGLTVGGYRLTTLLGRGGMGAVYLGEHPVLPRQVAIKVILRELAASADMRQRFFDEARLVAELHHPAFVDVLDLAELDDGRPYIMMEYLVGESLAAMMRRRGALPVGDAAAIAIAVLDGLAIAHERNVLHRDIKPQNLFVTEGGDHGEIKILDFGLAKLHTAGAGRTRTGALLGTPGYMAPEQASGTKDVDHRVDLYALGVVLYELVAGRPPFETDDWVDLLHLHRTADVPPIDTAPAELSATLARALAKRPDQRFATAREMADALRPLAGTVPVPAMVAPAPTPPPDATPPVDAKATRALGRRHPPAPAPAEAAHHVAPDQRSARASPDQARPSAAPPGGRSMRLGIAVASVGAAIAATALFASSRRDRSTAHTTESVRDAATTITAIEDAADDAPQALATIADAGVADATQIAIASDAAIRVPSRPKTESPPGTATSIAAAAVDAGAGGERPTYFVQDEVPTPRAWDFHARISWATQLARKIYDDAKLVSIHGSGLAPGGTVDLTANGYIEYTFRSASHSPRDRLAGQTFACLVTVTARTSGIQVGASNGTCDEPWFAAHCTGKQLWQIAISRGAAVGRVADLYLYPSETGHLWRLRPDEYYDIDDSSCRPGNP